MTGDLPDDRAYDANHYLWFREEAPGCFRIGITPQGAGTVGELVGFMPKRVDGRVEAGRSIATLESGKWVGAVRLFFAGTVVDANEAPIDDPALINRDPLGLGWFVVVRADDPDDVRARLARGESGQTGP